MTSMKTDASFAGGAYVDAAIIAALAERGLVDPARVSAWLDKFILQGKPAQAPDIQPAVLGQIADFQAFLATVAVATPAGMSAVAVPPPSR